MASLADPRNDNGSPSISRTDDNLSNSEGPLLNRNLGKNNTDVNSENVCGTKVVLSRNNAEIKCRDTSTTPVESTKRYCLFFLFCCVGIVGLFNLVLSIMIINVLRVSHGMEAMEVIPEENLVKFYGRTDLDKVCVHQGICQGYGDEPMEFTGDDAGVRVTVKNRHHNSPRANLQILKDETTFDQIESFNVKDLRTGNLLFSTNYPNFGLPSGVEKLAVNIAETHRIVSSVNSSLNFESDSHITLHGAESTSMESKSIVWMADSDINVKSNNSIILNGKEGIFLDIAKMPIVHSYKTDNQAESAQYKVCVCMPRGKLFRIPVLPNSNSRVNCAHVSTAPEHNPCL